MTSQNPYPLPKSTSMGCYDLPRAQTSFSGTVVAMVPTLIMLYSAISKGYYRYIMCGIDCATMDYSTHLNMVNI